MRKINYDSQHKAVCPMCGDQVQLGSELLNPFFCTSCQHEEEVLFAPTILVAPDFLEDQVASRFD